MCYVFCCCLIGCFVGWFWLCFCFFLVGAGGTLCNLWDLSSLTRIEPGSWQWTYESNHWITSKFPVLHVFVTWRDTSYRNALYHKFFLLSLSSTSEFLVESHEAGIKVLYAETERPSQVLIKVFFLLLLFLNSSWLMCCVLQGDLSFFKESSL